MTTGDTLSSGSFNLILWVVHQRGGDPQTLCRLVGVDPALLQNPDERIPIRAVQALWREAIAATADLDLPLKLGELINPLSLGVLAYVLMHCPTLGKAIEKLCHYQDVNCAGVRTTGHLRDNLYELTLQLTSADIIYPAYTLGSELSVYLATFRALTGQAVVAREIRFSFPQPAHIGEYSRVFGPAQLHFGASETVLVLESSWLETPVLNANPALFPLFEQHANELLRKLRQPALASRVREEIAGLLKGEEPTLATVADRLAMGVRTLQLHLKEEGVTYQQLLDEVRRDLAIRHLREPYLSTPDIAYLLGFSEPSVFYRTFKKWTGSTPGTYRSQLTQTPAA